MQTQSTIFISHNRQTISHFIHTFHKIEQNKTSDLRMSATRGHTIATTTFKHQCSLPPIEGLSLHFQASMFPSAT
jgi:hypothetical protein